MIIGIPQGRALPIHLKNRLADGTRIGPAHADTEMFLARPSVIVKQILGHRRGAMHRKNLLEKRSPRLIDAMVAKTR